MHDVTSLSPELLGQGRLIYSDLRCQIQNIIHTVEPDLIATQMLVLS